MGRRGKKRAHSPISKTQTESSSRTSSPAPLQTRSLQPESPFSRTSAPAGQRSAHSRPLANGSQQINIQQHRNDSREIEHRQVQERLFEQHKQLYLMLLKLGEDLSGVKEELKKNRREREKDLSFNVLDNIFAAVVKQLFPQDIYPTQDTLRDTLKQYLNERYPDFMANLSTDQFINKFHGGWASTLLLKMKNYRGTAVASVRSALWRIFGLERLPPLGANASAAEVVQWKQNHQVLKTFNSLFERNSNDTFWIIAIARNAFTETAVPNLTNAHCAFTLAVCDIFLNPQSKGVICTEKRIKLRMTRYIRDFENGGPSRNSVESVIAEELNGMPDTVEYINDIPANNVLSVDGPLRNQMDILFGVKTIDDNEFAEGDNDKDLVNSDIDNEGIMVMDAV